jgi:hypothetical protein
MLHDGITCSTIGKAFASREAAESKTIKFSEISRYLKAKALSSAAVGTLYPFSTMAYQAEG